MNLYSISISPRRNEDKSCCTNINILYSECLEIVKSCSNKYVISLEHGESQSVHLNHVQLAMWSDLECKSVTQKFRRVFENREWWNGFGKSGEGKCAVCKNRTTEPWCTIYPLKENPTIFEIVGVTEEEKMRWAAQDAAAPDYKAQRQAKHNTKVCFDMAVKRCAEIVQEFMIPRAVEEKIVKKRKIVLRSVIDPDDDDANDDGIVCKEVVKSVPKLEKVYPDLMSDTGYEIRYEPFMAHCMRNGLDCWRFFQQHKKIVMFVAAQMKRHHCEKSSRNLLKDFNDRISFQQLQDSTLLNLVDKRVDVNAETIQDGPKIELIEDNDVEADVASTASDDFIA